MKDVDRTWHPPHDIIDIRPPKWLILISGLLFVASSVVLGNAWLRMDSQPWALLAGAVIAAVALQLRTLITDPRSVLLSLVNAIGFAAALCLVPSFFNFDHATASHWTIMGTGVALISAPLLGRLWGSLLAAFDTLADMRARRERAIAAMAGKLDASMVFVRERTGGWAEVTIMSAGTEQMGSMTYSTFQRLPEASQLPALDIEGCLFLVHEPELEEHHRWSRPHGRGPRIVDAAQVELISGSLGEQPQPSIFSDLLSANVALLACHVIIVEVLILAPLLMS